jgi:hypothetical protein
VKLGKDFEELFSQGLQVVVKEAEVQRRGRGGGVVVWDGHAVETKA